MIDELSIFLSWEVVLTLCQAVTELLCGTVLYQSTRAIKSKYLWSFSLKMELMLRSGDMLRRKGMRKTSRRIRRRSLMSILSYTD